MRRTDYDREQHQDYARGRALTGQQLATWIDAFAAVLPERRPLVGLDVGSGTGRFTPALARAFGPVVGIEPSIRMREVAELGARAAGVQYLPGSAEDLPVPSGSADYALMFLSWNHVQDRPRAVGELARAVQPGGRLILRINFSDHHPMPWWLQECPRWYEVDASLSQPLHEVIALLTTVGWRVTDFRTVTEPSTATVTETLARLRLRTLSFFGHITADELDAGFRHLEAVVAADPDARTPAFAEPMLTLERSP